MNFLFLPKKKQKNCFSFRHCRGYLSLQRRRRAQVPPAPVVAEPAAGNDGEQVGEDEAEAEPVANEAANDIQRPRVCRFRFQTSPLFFNLASSTSTWSCR